MMQLRPYQEEAFGNVFAEWDDGHRKTLVVMPTGTGKTFAFGIPMIEHIDPDCGDVQGLILAPTRELAIQIGDELRGLLTYYQGIRVAVLYGGAGIVGQAKQLEKKPQIVVATPGRLMDHYNRKNIRLDKIRDAEGNGIPEAVPYAILIESDTPIVVQYSRLDTSAAEMALMTTIAYSVDE